MHQIVLLNSENKNLLEGNVLLSRRYRAKKTGLGQEGTRKIGKGQNIQLRKYVNTQMKEKTQQIGGWNEEKAMWCLRKNRLSLA